jgi:WhiB family redox-sensing transcriptional regulator
MTAPLWTEWFGAAVPSPSTGVRALTTAWDRNEWDPVIAHDGPSVGAITEWFTGEPDNPVQPVLTGHHVGRPHWNATLPSPPDWMRDAACVDSDIDFTDIKHAGPGARARALRTCATCPVIAACRQYAVNLGVSDGIWGGVAANRLRRLRATSAHPTGFCYVARVRDEVKVGYSTDPQRRVVRQLRGHVLAVIEGSHSLERTLHKALSAYRIHGEFYSDESDVFHILATFGFDFTQQVAA